MRRRQRLLLLATGLVAAVLGGLVQQTGALRRLELDSVDARFQVRGERAPPRDVALVLIDEKTLQELHARYPFARRYHARMLDRLRQAGAKVIGYDVNFTEPTTPVDDERLLDAIARDRPVLLAATAVNRRGETNVLGGGGIVEQLGARVGMVLFPIDPHGVLRRVPAGVRGVPHFAAVMNEMATGRQTPSDALGRDGEAWIDYAGPGGTYRAYSFIDVLRGRIRADRLRDRVVLVGASVPTSPDLHATSTTGEGQMSGTEILANAFDTVRRRAPLRSTGTGLNVAVIALLALIVPLLSLRLSPLRATAIGLAGGVGYVIAAQLAFGAGHVLPVVAPMLGLAVAGGGGLAVHYLGATVERERTRSTFARFVPEDVVSMALARTDGDLRLGGERLESTVLFCDLRAFTAWAEAREPPEVIELLNRYLEEMSDAIMDHGGTLVAYMGDGIMAVFGAPLPQDDHADRAFAAAREMLHRRLPRVNASLGKNGLAGGFRMGIGLNSGPVMSGNVGSSRRVEYTAVGDTTNTAARLEGMTKGTPHQLFMSDATRALLTAGTDDVVEAGELPVRGRSTPIRIWTLRA